MRRRVGTMAMAAIIAASMVMSSPVMAHAEELTDQSGVGDILDNIFGGDKPQGNPDDYKDAPDYDGVQNVTDDEINWGPTDSGNSNNGGGSGDSGNSGSTDSGNTGNSSSGGSLTDQSGVGDILDNIFGGDKPQGNPDDYKDAPDYDGVQNVTDDEISWGPTDTGNSNNGEGSGNGSSSISGSSSVGNVSVENVQAGTIVTGETATVTDGKGTVTTLPGSIFLSVKVTDPALTAAFPGGAVYAATPEGAVYFHSIGNDSLAYNVWHQGYVADQFYIVDAAGNLVTMTDPNVLFVNGKSYVSVTIPADTQGAQVLATEGQKSAFTRLFGVDGVMVNGVVLEEFQDTVKS